jgi:uncharacterized membrane protein YsdA (DUF1294 family)
MARRPGNLHRKPQVSLFHKLFFGWLALTSFIAFILFGYDKFRAGQSGLSRVSEFHLVLIGALGGWPGGLLGMLVFRHKTAKISFQLKYAVALLVWAGLIYLAVTELH